MINLRTHNLPLTGFELSESYCDSYRSLSTWESHGYKGYTSWALYCGTERVGNTANRAMFIYLAKKYIKPNDSISFVKLAQDLLLKSIEDSSYYFEQLEAAIALVRLES